MHGSSGSRGQLADAELRIRELQVDVEQSRQHELLAGAGDLLGALLGGSRRSSGLSRAARRRRDTVTSQTRLGSAAQQMSEKTFELQELEDELATEVVEIADRWQETAERIEPLEIPLEKSDVQVGPLMLVWVPK
ncbi:MAG: hypothetical protein ACRDVM_06255 [Acidimicrobiia bacterium]